MMEFYPSKGYTWKSAADTPSTSAKKTPTSAATDKTPAPSTAVVNTAKSVLRAQETQAFRHWMDRAIETSSLKIMQTRQAIDTPENDNAVKPSTSAIDLTSSQSRGKTTRKCIKA